MDRDLAQQIWRARRDRQILPAPSRSGAALDLATAYRVQQLVTKHRLAAGEHIVGWKLGYTSQVMRDQMGIEQPNFGPLTDVMSLASGDQAPDFLRQPRVEPEVALIVAREISAVTAAPDLVEHIAEARACLEIVDSSWQDYQFDLSDNTADSSSAGAFVLGDSLPLDQLSDIDVTLRITGEDPQSGTSDAAMGNPVRALAWLVEQLAERGETLPTGAVVLTGGLTRAIPLAPGGSAEASFHVAGIAHSVSVHRPQ